MSPEPAPRVIGGLSELLDGYDAFIFDLWGVLHDGKQCFPGVLPMLDNLRRAGKKIGLLGNTPRPVPDAADNIRKFGLLPELYDVLLTSGQLTFEALRDRPDPWLKALGQHCVHIGPEHEFTPYAGLGLRRAAHSAQAQFLFVTGIAEAAAALADFEPMLRLCLEKKLPLLCANPDLGVVKDGRTVLAAGALARHYEKMGGDARATYGKPHPEIFRCMLEQLGVAAKRALMVGDNLATDIAGARQARMAAAWITGGVHGGELAALYGAAPTPQQLRTYLAQHKAQPAYLMPHAAY